MAVDIEILPDRDLVYVTMAGQFGLRDALRMFDSYVSHPDFRPGMNILVDLREAYLVPTPDDLQNMATYVREHLSMRGTDYKAALVAESGIKRATAEIYQSLASSMPMDVQVFNDLDAAYDWLAT
ncbi:MAG TPA: STAS/SEC14 domain-containing protein [Gammaproteobacteria bacterium]|nr:STAS/SEC14 domain-containing protein [Gammaproteobacteria bacterium]